MNKIENAKALLQTHLHEAFIKTANLTGNMDHLHLGLLVVTPDFQGKTRIEQHQMVMDILKEPLQGEIHAVQITTMTPEKYERKMNEAKQSKESPS